MNQRGAIVVTGASSGIGRAVAMRLPRAGYRVFASVLSAAEAEEMKAAAPELEPFVLDIRDADSIQNALQTVSDALGGTPLRGLVNNAGILGCAPLELLSVAAARQVFEVNVIGQIALTQVFLPLLRRGQTRGLTSRIVNIGSLGGRSALPYTSPYSASKFAFRALSDAWRVELRAQGIAVILVEPGMVQTPIWQKGGALADEMAREFPPATLALYPKFLPQVQRAAQMAKKSGVTPEQVAEVVLRALQTPRPRAHYLIGREARLLLAVEKLPTRWRDWLLTRRFLN